MTKQKPRDPKWDRIVRAMRDLVEQFEIVPPTKNDPFYRLKPKN